jgi:hypothetical protein
MKKAFIVICLALLGCDNPNPLKNVDKGSEERALTLDEKKRQMFNDLKVLNFETANSRLSKKELAEISDPYFHIMKSIALIGVDSAAVAITYLNEVKQLGADSCERIVSDDLAEFIKESNTHGRLYSQVIAEEIDYLNIERLCKSLNEPAEPFTTLVNPEK